MAAELVTGIDIGTSSIKAVVLSHKGKLPKLIAYGSIRASQTGISSDADVDLDPEAKAIATLLASLKAPLDSVVVALPESKIFTRVVGDLPYLSDEELASAIRYSAEEFVPLPADQVNLYWQVIGRSKAHNSTAVLVIASPKNTVKRYLRVLEMAKVKPAAMETELIAAIRTVVGNNVFAPTTMIMQMGANSTDFAVVSKGMILLSRSIGTGGVALTRAISQYLNLELPQAEEYKKVYGLLEEQLEGKIFQVLKPLVDVMASEARRVIQAFEAKNPQNPIKRIVLTGGGAKLPGVVIYFANSLGMEIQEADPWSSVEKDQGLIQKLATEGPAYTVAVGLALREG